MTMIMKIKIGWCVGAPGYLLLISWLQKSVLKSWCLDQDLWGESYVKTKGKIFWAEAESVQRPWERHEVSMFKE